MILILLVAVVGSLMVRSGFDRVQLVRKVYKDFKAFKVFKV
jgi:hypothetical protein